MLWPSMKGAEPWVVLKYRCELTLYFLDIL